MKNYITSIIIAGIICSIIDLLLDKKTATGKIAKILTGILMSVTILTPFTNISFKYITNYFDSLSFHADNYVEQGKFSAQNSISEIIKAQTEAYILDKANALGANIQVEVMLSESQLPVPEFVKISGVVSPYVKKRLSVLLEEDLGISEENQIWT